MLNGRAASQNPWGTRRDIVAGQTAGRHEIKILWHSNHPCVGTGYGTQTALFTPMIKEAGHDVAISAFYGQHGWVANWKGMTVYPGGADQYGNDVILRHAAHHFGGDLQDGLIITLVDAWVLRAAEHTRARVANWAPVDHEPIPPMVKAYFEGSGSVPIAMSRFGFDQLTEFDPVYVPHGVDTDIFSPKDKQETKRALDLPEDSFLVGMVAANKGFRKGFPQAIAAFADFQRRHENAILFLQTEPAGICSGHNLPACLSMHDVPLSAVRLADQYQWYLGYPQEHMAKLYNAFDVLLNPAFGEGFGIPILEAQACGTPVIITDWTSMTELCGAGWKVSGQKWWSEQGSFQLVPDIEEIIQALEEAYDQAASLGERAREFALNYDARTVMERYWLPALAEIEKRTVPPELPPVVEMALAA